MISQQFEPILIHLDRVSSTNEYIKINYKSLENHTIISADVQTKGRGQFGRIWESEPKKNLLCSILIKDDLPQKSLNPYIIDVLLETLRSFQFEPRFESPNDIYINDNKIAGILIETAYFVNKPDYIIIGIGLNINQLEFEDKRAISMKKIAGKEFVVRDILAELIFQMIIHWQHHYH